MKITHKIKIHLDDNRLIQPIDVMQGDAYTRQLECSLYSGNTEWTVPDGVSVAVGYCGSSGRGAYDTLPDGSKAYTVAGNVVTVTLIPQVTARSGVTAITIVFTDDNGKQLATFGIAIRVQPNPAAGAGEPANYYNLREWASTPLHVYITKTSQGKYAADEDYDTIRREYEAGRQILCVLETEDQEYLEFPLVRDANGVLEFGGTSGGTVWQMLISQSEDGSAAVEVGSTVYGEPPLYVTMTGDDVNGYKVDHTYEQIKAANDAGRAVFCVYITTIMVLAAVTESMVAFQTVYSKGTYRRAFIYASASQPPKTETMKFVLAEDLEGLESAPEIYIGSDEPTDPNVCLWVDPSDEAPEAGGGSADAALPSEGSSKWELINEMIITEEVSSLTIDTDSAGNHFDLDEIRAVMVKETATTGSWYFYVNGTSSFSVSRELPAKATIICEYRKCSGALEVKFYQYGSDFMTSKIITEKIDSNGMFIPQVIDRFKTATFAGGVLPIGTHVAVYGRRAST